MTALSATSSTIGTDQSAANRARLLAAINGGSADATTSTADASASGTEDRFLKLLVAQMRNQDPLNPMDNAQVTSQLAQINTVRGIESLNASMSKLVERGASASATDSVGMLGRQVLAAGDEFSRDVGGGTSRLGFELAGTARGAVAEVLDSAGKVVFTRSFQSPAAGVTTFDWNGSVDGGGTAPAGQYRLRVSATDGSNPVAATALSSTRVIGVSQDGAAVRLDLAGRAGVAPGAIKAIF